MIRQGKICAVFRLEPTLIAAAFIASAAFAQTPAPVAEPDVLAKEMTVYDTALAAGLAELELGEDRAQRYAQWQRAKAHQSGSGPLAGAVPASRGVQHHRSDGR